MSERHIRNALRQRAMLVSRSFKTLFAGGFRPVRARPWRRLFLAEDDATVRRAGEHVLANMRDFCFAQKSTSDPDPYVVARREGRREVWLRITKYLNLDEAQVQEMMEIEDGL